MRIQIVLLLVLSLICCDKIEDASNISCTQNCSTINYKFVSTSNQPLNNIHVKVEYLKSRGSLGGYQRRILVDEKSNSIGEVFKRFFIKNEELGSTSGWFNISIDDSNLNNNKYITSSNGVSGFGTVLGSTIYSIVNRDTIISNEYYFPKKAFIKVHLNNFSAQHPNDYFEVQSMYPFGKRTNELSNLNSYYSTGFSGWGVWKSTEINKTFLVYVAESENNIIRIRRRKNNIDYFEDVQIYVPANNNIQLSFDF